MLAKAMARAHRRPLMRLDLGAAKHGIVGSSEERVRACFKTIRAVTGGAVLFVATSNGLGLIPPELRRRFKLGTFMFELPDAAALAALFATYLAHHAVPASHGPRLLAAFADWTGAEVETVCRLASRLGCTVDAAADYVVPVARSMPERITRLREEAHGRYLDARKRGVYRVAGTATAEPIAMAVGRVARAYGES
jgi:SpoVK/Ycf46/Vps4 family AAA+-type ATPase